MRSWHRVGSWWNVRRLQSLVETNIPSHGIRATITMNCAKRCYWTSNQYSFLSAFKKAIPSQPLATSSVVVSCFSTSSKENEPVSDMVPPLDTWKKCLSKIPLSIILPIGMGNDTDVANRTAFFGDKVLNHRISQILRQRQLKELADQQKSDPDATEHSTPVAQESDVYFMADIGYLTLIQGQAMSNQFFSQYFPLILGSHPDMTHQILELATQQIHDAGTMVEATVDAILNYEPNDAIHHSTNNDAEQAIEELARYLVHMAYEATLYFNAKGQLLELGGTVISYRLDDTPEHCPKFRAIANYKETTYRSDPPSSTKKLAEQIAATYILRQYQHICKSKIPVSFQRLTFDTTAALNNAADTEEKEEAPPEDDESMTNDAIKLANYDEDLVEDGALPDDFYSDISNLATVDSLDDDDGRPYDAKRFALPKLNKRTQKDFFYFLLPGSKFTVKLRDGESRYEAWRRGAYERDSSFHRTILAPLMLPDHVETVNCWTRMASNDVFTAVIVVVLKEKLSFQENKIYPTVKCFVRHDESRNKARNALSLVINQYIDQVILGNRDPPQVLGRDIQPDKKLWRPLSDEEKSEFRRVRNKRKL